MSSNSQENCSSSQSSVVVVRGDEQLERSKDRIRRLPKLERRQGIFWLLTIPFHCFTPFLPKECQWIRGQLERGESGGAGESGYLHWQLICAFKSKRSLGTCRDVFGAVHAELSRSSAASDYVWKESTRVEGTQFDLGTRPIAVNVKPDWESVWDWAKAGDLESIPAGIRVRSYHALRRIQQDNQEPQGMARSAICFWGVTGSGKSRRAWEEAGLQGYSKDPRSKFWCGYRGQVHVVLDEFRGGIDIAHVLRWLDCYPVIVETKGGSVPLVATRIWFTSNLDPANWYPEADQLTRDALFRKMEVVYYGTPYVRPTSPNKENA